MPPIQPPLFPSYLLPTFTFPFRRKSSTTSSTTLPSLTSSPRSSISSSSSPPTSPSAHTPQSTTRLRKQSPSTLRCLTCAADIAFTSQILSKGFTGRHGRAYLVSPPSPSPSTKPNLLNTRTGRSVSRDLLTGAHVVADVSCRLCGTVLGWKYVDAREVGQRYKIGKFILEMQRVVGCVGWEDLEEIEGEGGFGEEEGDGERDGEGVVVFDSGDEEECEEVFAGVWDAESVGKRRGGRVGRRG